MGDDAGEVDAAGAMFDEDQGVQALEGEGAVQVQEVGGEDAVGLGGEELAPGLAGALRCGVDAGGVQDLPDRGWRDRVAEAGEFALDPAVAPGAVVPGQAQDELLDGVCGGRPAGAMVRRERPLPRNELAVLGQQRGRRDCEYLVPAFPWDQSGKDGEPDPIGRHVADSGDLAAQHRVLVP